MTVTAADEVAEPVEPVAVRVYVVVTRGLTTTEPEADTVPGPGKRVTTEAPVVDQVSVADPPAAIVVGAAVRVAVGGVGVGAGAVS